MQKVIVFFFLSISITSISQDNIDAMFADGGRSVYDFSLGVDPVAMAALNNYSLIAEYPITEDIRVQGGIGGWVPRNNKEAFKDTEWYQDGHTAKSVYVKFSDNFKLTYQLGILDIIPFYVLNNQFGFIFGTFYRHTSQDYVANLDFPYKTKNMNSAVFFLGWQFFRGRLFELNYSFGMGPQFVSLVKDKQFEYVQTLPIQKTVEFEVSLKFMYKF